MLIRHRFGHTRTMLATLGLALAGLALGPVSTDGHCRDTGPAVAVPPAATPVELEVPFDEPDPFAAPATRGIDLELRVLNVRIEFPWLKNLPISPGHRLVIAWFPTSPPNE
jgi:hypothetical protein